MNIKIRPIQSTEYHLLEDFLQETPYIDFSAENIQSKAAELFDGISDNIQKARIAYEFV